MKNVLIINGHPNSNSFCSALAEGYINGINKEQTSFSTINLSELSFNPNLKFGYQKRIDLEPDLQASWDKIQKANHIVIIYPNWWGTYPALLKGFIERLFLPGLAFEKVENSVFYKKLLKGKTAHIMVTMDSPSFYYRLFLKSPGHNSMKRSILGFCGIKTIGTTTFHKVSSSSEKKRKKWIEKAFQMGEKYK